MTTLNFALTRTAAREFGAGDEIVVTGLDHDANVSPWLELAHDLGLVVRFVGHRRGHDARPRRPRAAARPTRTKVVAFPLAANSVGTLTDAPRIAELAHEAGALAWADAVHYAPHGPIDVAALGVDVLICSPYKFFGPHLGIAFARARAARASWRPYKVRPAPNQPLGRRFETGTLPHELLAGFVAAVEYIESIGWDAIQAQERALGERFLAGLPDGCTLHGCRRWTAASPTFAFTATSARPREIATTARRPGHRRLARRLLRARGDAAARARGRRRRARRASSTTTPKAEVDRLLEALSDF